MKIFSLLGYVLFECGLPTIKETLLLAIKSDANLYGADLYRANLSGANLSGAKKMDLAISQTRILPDGDLIVYKKVYLLDGKKTIAKLLIPKDAKRSSAFGRKCRSEYADVIEIENGTIAYSKHDKSFIYEVGKRVTPRELFDDNWQEECASGIHFFITKLEAQNY